MRMQGGAGGTRCCKGVYAGPGRFIRELLDRGGLAGSRGGRPPRRISESLCVSVHLWSKIGGRAGKTPFCETIFNKIAFSLLGNETFFKTGANYTRDYQNITVRRAGGDGG